MSTKTLFFRLAIAALAVSVPATALIADDDTDKIEKLTSKMHDLYSDGKYSEALDVGKELLKLEPNNGETLYNVGCLYARTGQKDEAIDHLEKATKAGYRDVAQFEKDPDLATIRDDSRFKSLVAGLRGGAAPASVSDDGDDRQPDDSVQPVSDRQKEVQRLTQRVIEEAQKGNNEKALDLAEEALDIAPDMWITNYNVACMHARLGQRQEALKYLQLAVDKGLNDPKQIENDSDLNNIRQEPKYRDLIAGMKGGTRPSPTPVTPQPPPTPTPAPVRPQNPVVPTIPITPAPPSNPVGNIPIGMPWHVSLPADFDRELKSPLIVALHPQGTNMRIGTEEWEDAASTADVILLTPQGTVNAGPDRYEWDMSSDRSVNEIMSAIEQVCQEYRIDTREIVLAGTDQGATLACMMALRYPDRFAGVIAVSPHINHRESRNLIENNVAGLSFYFMVDEDAPDAKVVKEFYKALKKADARAKFEDFEDLRDLPRKKRLKEQGKAIKYVLEEVRKQEKKERKKHKEDEDD